MPALKNVVRTYMKKVPMVHEHCQRCLASERWHGDAVLMVVDAAFDSIGLNYFQSVVPKVEMFRQLYIQTGKVRSMEDLVSARVTDLREIWRNERSWHVALEVACHFASIKKKHRLSDRETLIRWAHDAPLAGWDSDPVGRIRGVGINTYQYLRMMGGVDTVMPDKIVKRVIYEILEKASMPLPQSDIEFVTQIERLAPETGYKAIEMCWMTWLIQSEAGLSRTEKYASLLPKI